VRSGHQLTIEHTGRTNDFSVGGEYRASYMTADHNTVRTTRVEENLLGIVTVSELKLAGASGLMEVDENSGTSGDVEIKFCDILDISAWEVEYDIVISGATSKKFQLGI